MAGITRRRLIGLAGRARLGAVSDVLDLELNALEAGTGVDNPLLIYLNRDWEKVCRDQYGYDDGFTAICAPNDTHMCRTQSHIDNVGEVIESRVAGADRLRGLWIIEQAPWVRHFTAEFAPVM